MTKSEIPVQDPSPSSLSTEERRLLLDQRKADGEAALKSRELDLKQLELKKPIWRDPVAVGVIAAAVGVIGSLTTTAFQNRAAHTLAAEKSVQEAAKANADVITELIKNVDTTTAKRNLQVAISVGLVRDSD